MGLAGGIGQAVPRKEDARLLTGRGRYLPDIVLPNMAFAAIVRSPHAHARIRAIDKSRALKSPGVIAVLTGADFEADGRNPIPHAVSIEGMPDVTLRLFPGHEALHRVDRDIARRQGALRRRAGGDGDRGRAHGGEGCGRAGRGRLRAASRPWCARRMR